jgi:hypothetical protein
MHLRKYPALTHWMLLSPGCSLHATLGWCLQASEVVAFRRTIVWWLYQTTSK